jgi:hypothetical protein
VDVDGNRTLINSTATGALKAYRERVGPPSLSIRFVNGQVEITYDGILSSSTTPGGTYTDITGAPNPYRVPATGTAMFFRSHR